MEKYFLFTKARADIKAAGKEIIWSKKKEKKHTSFMSYEKQPCRV